MHRVLAVGLAGGKGLRLQPLTVKAGGYLRSKAAVRFLGERIVTWLCRMLRDQGVDQAYMITRGKENRSQVKSALYYGEHLGMTIAYSTPDLDAHDNGSAGALLHALPHYNVMRPVLFVFPTDSLLEFDLPAMLAQHRRTGAAVTIATAEYPAEMIANTYGMIDTDGAGRVQAFYEKPSLDAIHAYLKAHPHRSTRPLPTNAGFYLMDVSVLREVAAHHEITARQGELLDIGGHLLPWMVAHGYPVHTFTVESMGDLGNISSYVQTLSDALCGQFPSLHPYMQEHPEAPARCYIDPTSWDMADQISGLSLREKVARKMVKLYAPLRIGRYVRIEPGVTLSTCNIDDECLVQRGASIMRSSIGEGSFIGPHSWLIDTVVGMMASIRSNAEKPVSLTASCALGDEVTLYPGVQLSNQVAVYPRMVIPTGVKLDRPTLVTSPDDLPASAYPHAPLPLPALPDFGSLGTTTTALRW